MDHDATECLVGVDGGASTVRAWRMRRMEARTLVAEEPACRREIPRRPDFRPAPLAHQLADRAAGVLQTVPGETAQAACVLEHTVATIRAAAGAAAGPLVLGICMPGLKDEAG